MGREQKKIIVRDVMTKSVISVDATVNVNDAAKMMEDAKVGAIIVMENNSPIGIITDRDFAVKIVAHAYPITTPVKTIMSTPLIGISPEESIWHVADLMYAKGVRKIPVIEKNKVIGIITSTDLVNKFAVATEEDLKNMYFQSIAKIFVQSHYV
jgi:CBS domain-containing protein